MTLVLDASAACKLFVAEPGSDAVEALMSTTDMLIAPDLIVPELGNVAWLKHRGGQVTGEQARAIVNGLPDILDELVPSVDLAARALEIALALGHPAYDCFYVALAERRGARLVTADRRLLARLAETPWASLAIGLGDERVD